MRNFLLAVGALTAVALVGSHANHATRPTDRSSLEAGSAVRQVYSERCAPSAKIAPGPVQTKAEFEAELAKVMAGISGTGIDWWCEEWRPVIDPNKPRRELTTEENSGSNPTAKVEETSPTLTTSLNRRDVEVLTAKLLAAMLVYEKFCGPLGPETQWSVKRFREFLTTLSSAEVKAILIDIAARYEDDHQVWCSILHDGMVK
jgi:hypothetical protein